MKWLKDPAWINAIGTIILVALALVSISQGPAIGWLHWPGFVLPLIVVCVLLAAAILNFRTAKLHTTTTAKDVSLPPQQSHTWCDTMAEDDAKKIQERVRTINQRKEFQFNQGSEPYLDVITDLCNCTVYELVTSGEITGQGTYAGSQFAALPRLLGSTGTTSRSLKHGEVGTFTFRQYLSHDLADRMWADRDRGVAIDFSSVVLSFKAILDGSLTKTQYRLAGPSRFGFSEAKRV